MVRTFAGVALATVVVMTFGFAAEHKDHKDKAKANKAKVPLTAVIEKTTAVISAVGVISPQENDRRIARWLAVDNDALQGCSEMAREHASNTDVKEFAKTVAADHKRFHDMLKKDVSASDSKESAVKHKSDEKHSDAKHETTDDKATQAADDSEKTATLLKDEGQSRDGRLAYKPTDFLEVKEKVCHDLRAKAEKEFKELKGTEFDHAFLTHMIFGHEALLATIDAVQANAGESLQTTLKDLHQSAEKHLKEARRLHNEHRQQTVARDAETQSK